MAKQTFKTRLNFQQVEAGTAEDTVLVRTANGDVKEVSQSSIGGGSQDLQSVMKVGSAAQVIDNGNYYSLGLAVGEDFVSIGLDNSCNNGDRSVIQQFNGKLTISEQHQAGEHTMNTSLLFETPIAETQIRFPAKPDGEYTIATLDDIARYNFQQLIDASTGTSDYEVAYYDCGVDGPEKAIGFKANLEGTIYSSNFGLSAMNLNRYTPSIGKNTNATYDSQYFVLLESTYPDDLPIRGISYTLDRIYISSNDPSFGVGSLNLAYPALRYTDPAETDKTIPISVNGSFADTNGNIETTVNNTTTTPLSSSDLDTAYPSATIGFRVHALSIAGGAIVYEKSATGWIQQSVTVVS